MKTRKTLLAEIAELKQDNATLRLLTKGYMRKNKKLEEDIALLNASLDATVASMEHWHDMAKKADERRRDIVRAMGNKDS